MSTSGYAESFGAARTQSLFGRVMGLVAVTVGFATLGVYLGRNIFLLFLRLFARS
jgi:hypothetical protein